MPTVHRGLRGPDLHVQGAAENNLRDIDVTFPGGITAVVGVSGSGKSSLVFDTIYHEARRRFVESLALPTPRSQPARVRAIDGLSPAVAVAQNVVNLNPNSTVATAVGVHPFLRVLYARFAERSCPRCGEVARTASPEVQLAALRALIADAGTPVEVVAPLMRGVEGSHRRLLLSLREDVPREAIEVDGRRWTGRALDPDRPHDIAVRVGSASADANLRTLRGLLESVVALGSTQVTFRCDGRSQTYSRAPLCSHCGSPLPVARPPDFRSGGESVSAYRLGGRALPDLLALEVDAAMAALDGAALPAPARRAADQVQRRLSALSALGLGYLSLDRPSPTLSRGEAQRVRLAVILANDIEDLLHVVDEPTIGLDPAQVSGLMSQLARLRGPVLLVEHDRNAVAAADHVVELGPDAGPGGGRLVFAGPPARLWSARTRSGEWFSGRARVERTQARVSATDRLTVRRARLHNLRGFDCSFPVGVLTVVTGPSGAGKSTLVRDVLVGSLEAGEPVGCQRLDGPRLRPVFVDQSPIGRNPRSNPATYTGLAERIRAIFAAGTGAPGSSFSFNRREGACPGCEGMGAVEVSLRFLPSQWLVCEACQGRRFGQDVLDLRVDLADGARYSISEVYATTVDDAVPLFAGDARARRILQALTDVGLGYLQLGQASPSLSGGEAQRVKLARQLAAAGGAQLVLLDEPTTGLHPANLSQLVRVLHTLVDSGSTVVVVEHHPQVVAAADWVVQLGPGGGPRGGELMLAGPPSGTADAPPRPRRTPRPGRRQSSEIRIRDATANNLRGVSVALPKGALTGVVGVSGSGKSSLVRDVLEAEATRRLLECLSLYERQSVREGPQASVGSITGLGPTVAIGPERGLANPRRTIGTATELSFYLGLLLAYAGVRTCPQCGGEQRRHDPAPASAWRCTTCGAAGPGSTPADFSPATYEAACVRCHGIGTVSVPRVDRLVTRPDQPLCGGALHSPGFYPGSYLCKPDHGGYWMLRALGERYGFDPEQTPWRQMSEDAREAFLFGEEQVQLAPQARRSASRVVTWRGVYRIVAEWDIGGLYTEHVACPECRGARLRPPLLDVHLAGMNRHALHHEPVADVARTLAMLTVPAEAPHWAGDAHLVVQRRLRFLERVGLGYLHLDRLSGTLSAGEVQRVKLTALLGSSLVGMTILLDEPSRGLHPSEADALVGALGELRDGGNTVVFVDHDPRLIRAAEHLVVLGPGAGRAGGCVVAAGTPAQVARQPVAKSIVDNKPPDRVAGPRREPTGVMLVRKPTENNLCGDDVPVPLGVLVGVCGVSGSGKSTLAIDIIARALAPAKQTTSVAEQAVDPGAHDGIDGAPPRAIHSDQSRAGIRSPGAFLGVLPPLRRGYAASAEAQARGVTEDDLVPRCDACKGRGSIREDMLFMPAVEQPCDACEATGYRAEARELVVRELSLPELETRTLSDILDIWGDNPAIAAPLRAAVRLGLGYLSVGQRSRSLSGGERQRLKLARELAKPTSRPTLYILDEPTVGLHGSDIARLVDALDELVRAGHSVLLVDHDPTLLACCDRLLELGPQGGPAGGRVVAAGTPEQIAAGATPTAPYLRTVLR